MEDSQLDDLYAKFEKLEKGQIQDVLTTSSSVSSSSSKWKSLFSKYGIYILFFIYVLLFIFIVQPYWLYKKDENTDKYTFLWKRFLFLFMISYGLLLVIYIVFNYYIKKIT
jgi:hypothetical protein